MSHLRVCTITIISLLLAGRLSAQDIGVRAAVSSQEIYRGEQITYQIQIEGSDTPEKPDTSGIADFEVTFESERANNSHSVTIINGQRSEVVRRGYLYTYRLTPRKPGVLTIPPVSVAIDGRSYRTNPVRIQVNEPRETDNYKLRLFLSKDSCYVGEGVVLRVVWYWDVERRATSLSSFSVPVLSSDGFRIVPIEPKAQGSAQLLRIPVQGEETIVVQDETTLDGRRFTALSFERRLVPKGSGIVEIPSATVVFEGVTGYEEYRDFFGRTARREVTAKFVVPSNTLSLTVRDLPTEGRPASFSGLIGTYHIEATAAQTAVSVGDPITITIGVYGDGIIDEYHLPPLAEISTIAEGFKIPDDRAEGRTEGNGRIFTQTIRARSDKVETIPSISLTYFDPERGEYITSRTNPIPITVKETRIVTLRDVEGDEPISRTNELEAMTEGIAHNYDDLEVIEDREIGISVLLSRPFLLAGLGIFPLLYIGLLLALKYGQLQSRNESVKRERAALRVLEHGAKSMTDASVDIDRLFDTLKQFLADRCGLPRHSMTIADVRKRLSTGGVREQAIAEIDEIFTECEAGRYGGMESKILETLPERIVAVARRIDGELK